MYSIYFVQAMRNKFVQYLVVRMFPKGEASIIHCLCTEKTVYFKAFEGLIN